MKKKQKLYYKKPKITTKKIKTNFFLTNKHFFNDIEDLLIPNVFPYGGTY